MKIPNFGITDCFIAGGSVLSHLTKTPVNDYDIYPKSLEGFKEAILTLLDDGFLLNITDRAITIKSNSHKNFEGERQIFQVMYEGMKFFPDADAIFSKFDYSVCQAAYDLDTNQLHISKDFWSSVASREIRFNPETRYPLASLLRVKKYQDKGYKFPQNELIKMALTLADRGFPRDWKDLSTQIGGIYGNQFKLDTKDLPFNFENAIKVIQEFDPDTCEVLDTIDLSEHTEAFKIFVDCITNNQEILSFKIKQKFDEIKEIDDEIVVFVGNGTLYNDKLSVIPKNIFEKYIVYLPVKIVPFEGYIHGHIYYTKEENGLFSLTYPNNTLTLRKGDTFKGRMSVHYSLDKKTLKTAIHTKDVDSVIDSRYHNVSVTGDNISILG